MRFTLISCDDGSKKNIEIPKEMIKVQKNKSSKKMTKLKTVKNSSQPNSIKKKRKKKQISKRLL